MDHTILPHKWGFIIFPSNIYPHRTRNLFQFSKKNPYCMNLRKNNPPCIYNSSIHRVCTSLRANILLRSYSNHKDTFIISIYRRKFNHMIMRRFFCFSTNSKSNILPTLFSTNCTSCISFNTFNIST